MTQTGTQHTTRRALALALLLCGFAFAGCTKVATESGSGAPPSAGASSAAAGATGVPLAGGAVDAMVVGDTTSGGNGYTQHGTLRIGDTQDVNGLNPHIVTSTSLGNLSEMTMAYLARYDVHNEPVPELATVIPSQANGGISKDGLSITWHLRKGVKWSDGAPFDGDDVVFSTKAVLNPANNEVGRDGWDLIDKIDEPDKFTVVFHLRKPYAGFLPLFFGSAGANPCLLPKHILGNLPNINNAPYNALPVGIGPFRYVKWVRSDHIELEANPYYWRGQPKIKHVIYKFVPDINTLYTQLQTGEVDLWPYASSNFYSRLIALGGHAVIRQPSNYFAHLDFNMQNPVLGHDLAVREALRYATDREAIRLTINHGLGVLQDGMVPPGSPAYDPNLKTIVGFDLAKANALLDGDGWKAGSDGVRAKNGKRLSFTFATVSGNAAADAAIELLRAWWKQIGVAIEVRHYQPALFFAPYADGGIIYAGKFDITTFSWGGDPIGELSNLYSCKQWPPNGQNDPRYCNQSVDANMARFKASYDPKVRLPFVEAEQQQIVKDVPTIVLRVNEDLFAYNNDLKGFVPPQLTPFDNVMNMEI